ncbi:MAG: AAA family ATPase [Acidimicrobiia bacterium]|nr:AAA family ATPase [Acidimicrobiia bacterium]
MQCASCGLQIPDGARFCSHCGAAQSSLGEERRVVTALFADVVGFTTLAERMDPEQVKHLIDRAFERLARDITMFGGVVDKVVGDEIIALFGAPVAHEDDAERAVRAALRMQHTMDSLSSELDPPLHLRIGLNTGEVLVGTTTAGGDYTAMGDVMNSASRLQELANPGETLVGEATRAATGEALVYRSVGPLPARGREEPLQAWVALRAVRPPGFHRQHGNVFVGRTHEMNMLAAQAQLAIDGHRAQLSVVSGEAGMGKTRLVNEASATMASQFRARVLDGRCLPYGEANVWWPVADLVRDLFDLTYDMPYDRAEADLQAALAEHLPVSSPAAIERYTVALLHALGYDTELRGGDRNRNRSEVVLAFTTVLDAEVSQRPVVIVLSDMHWAATAVWELVDHVLTELARAPLVVLTTARSGEHDHLPRGRHGLSVIQLGPLDDLASAELLAQLGTDLPEVIAGELVDRSGGNPFFLEELAGLVAKDGDALPATDGDDFDVDAAELPATLRGIIAARLDALDNGERSLLEDAAVLGRTGPIDGLATMARETRRVAQIDLDLTALIDKDLLEVSGGRYRFVSNLVRDVAYGRLTKMGRAQQHHGIARYLESQQPDSVRNSVVVAIAEHYRAAAHLASEVANVPGVDRAEVISRALYWLEQAGERALDVGAPLDAARWFDFGVDLATDEAATARFLFGRARAWAEIHDIAAARSDLERLDTFPDLDPVMLARSLLTQGEVDRKAGDLDRAAARLREAADRMAVLGVADQQALALRLLGMTEMVRSDASLARQALESSRAVAVAAGDRRAEAWALQSLAWQAFRQGRVLEARSLVTEAIDTFTELDDRGGLVWTKGVLAWVAFHTGDWEQARLLIDTVLPETQRRGDPWAEGITLSLDASLQLWSGNAQAAFELAQQAREVAERLDDSTLAVGSRAIEGRALVSLGRLDEGTTMLDEAFSLADQAGDRESRRVAVVTNCASAARLGEAERAIRWAARYDGLHDDPSVVGEAELIVSLALAMLQRGAVAEAASQLLWVEASATEQFGNYAAAVGSIVAAAQGAVDEAEQLVERTETGPSTYLDRVFALLARAAVRFRSGDEPGCEGALAAARAVIEETDDQPTRLLIELVAAVCGRGSVAEAEARMRRTGFEPAGWLTAYRLAASPASRT